MVKKVFLILGALLMVSGCSISSSVHKGDPKTPDWYIEPPKEDLYNVYGVGEGFTHQEAIAVALANINNALGVKIKVDYKNEVSYSSSTMYFKDQKTNKVIETSSDLLEFTNYEVVSSFERLNKILVLVRLDKVKYGAFIKDKVQKEVKRLKNEEEYAKNINYLSKLKLYRELDLKAKELGVYIKVYGQITGYRSRLSREARYLRVFEENYQKVLNNRNVTVRYDEVSKLVRGQFEGFLSENRFSIKQKLQPLVASLECQKVQNPESDITTYRFKLSFSEDGFVIKTVVFNIKEYGEFEKHYVLLQKHFKKEIELLLPEIFS